jgi:hypothetical protein
MQEVSLVDGFRRIAAYFRHSPRRPSTCRPSVEGMESRELLAARVVPRSFLFTPIPETATLAEHIHPILTININGQNVPIPTGIGLGPTGDLPIHTHDSSGIIHVESTKKLPFRLKDFFTIWGQKFDAKHILGYTADRTHKISMTVDGRPSRLFGALPLQDLQQIVISYEPIKKV